MSVRCSIARAVSLAACLLVVPIIAPVAAPAGDVRRVIDDARRHFAAGEHAAALAALRSIEGRVGDDGSVRWNIARCLEELGRVREAIAEFERARALTTDRAQQAEADRRVAALRRRLPGALQVECGDGEVVLDGRRQACPARFDALPPGPIGGRLDGRHGSRPFTAVIRPDATTRLRLAAPPPAPPPAPVSGGVSWTGWALVGVGILSVAGGALAMVGTDTLTGEAGRATDPDRYAALRDDYDRVVVGGYVAYGLGAALMGAGAWLIVDEALSAPGVAWRGSF